MENRVSGTEYGQLEERKVSCMNDEEVKLEERRMVSMKIRGLIA